MVERIVQSMLAKDREVGLLEYTDRDTMGLLARAALEALAPELNRLAALEGADCRRRSLGGPGEGPW